MKRAVLIGLVTVLISIPLTGAVEAQTIQFFSAKFVCGFELGNVRLLNDPRPLSPNTDPYEDLKPGNYATLLNVLNLNFSTQTVATYFTTEETGLVFGTSFLVTSFGTSRVDCTDVVAALAPAFPVPLNGQVVEGYALIIVPNAAFEADGVYTFESQNAFERHLLWALDFEGNVQLLFQRLALTIPTITSPIAVLPFFEPVQALAASGAGGNGLGASIDVEEFDLTVVSLVAPDGGVEENPVPIP